jgi:hypothetical protein
MIRRCVFEEGLLMDISLKSWQDDDMVLSVNKLYKGETEKIVHCKDIVLQHNFSQVSITSNKKNLYMGIRSIVKKYKKDILSECGRMRLMYWYVRVLYRFCESKYNDINFIIPKRIVGTIGNACLHVCKKKFRHIWG